MKKRKLIDIIAWLFFAMFTVTIVSIISFLYMNNKQNSILSDILQKNQYFSTVNLALVELEVPLTNYIRDPSEASTADFHSKIHTLRNAMERLKQLPDKDNSLIGYLRRLEIFIDFLESSVQQEVIQTEDWYNLSQFIKIALASHIRDSQGITTSSVANIAASYTKQIDTVTIQQRYIWFVLLFTILFCTGFIFKVIIQMRKYFLDLQQYANALANREWNVHISNNSVYEEIDNVTATMTNMKNQLTDYFKTQKENAKLSILLSEEKLQNEKKDKLLIESQLSVLKAQINPHFIFNTLNIVSKVAILGESEKVMDITEKLSLILRYSLYNQDSLVTLEQELDIISAYTEIQKIRFQDSVNILIKATKEAHKVKIPPMLIQPLVENCFKHAFKEDEILLISLEATIIDDMLIVSISDNGCGFDSSAIDFSCEQKHLGIKNIQKRLNLIYLSYGFLQISSKKEEGTNMTIHIPVYKEF